MGLTNNSLNLHVVYRVDIPVTLSSVLKEQHHNKICPKEKCLHNRVDQFATRRDAVRFSTKMFSKVFLHYFSSLYSFTGTIYFDLMGVQGDHSNANFITNLVLTNPACLINILIAIGLSDCPVMGWVVVFSCNF